MRGGYTLTRDPEEINLWEIITALDSHTTLVDCVLEPEVCDRSDDCLTRSIWTLLSARMKEFWSSFTLADLHQDHARDRGRRPAAAGRTRTEPRRPCLTTGPVAWVGAVFLPVFGSTRGLSVDYTISPQ